MSSEFLYKKTRIKYPVLHKIMIFLFNTMLKTVLLQQREERDLLLSVEFEQYWENFAADSTFTARALILDLMVYGSKLTYSR